MAGIACTTKLSRPTFRGTSLREIAAVLPRTIAPGTELRSSTRRAARRQSPAARHRLLRRVRSTSLVDAVQPRNPVPVRLPPGGDGRNPSANGCRPTLVDDQVVHLVLRGHYRRRKSTRRRASLPKAIAARDRVLAARRQEVERLQYQARLADRQFQRSDPDNRLVTGETERGRWEEALVRVPRKRRIVSAKEEAQARAWPFLAILPELVQERRTASPKALGAEAATKTAEESTATHLDRQGGSCTACATDRVRVRVSAAAKPSTTELRVPVGSFTRLVWPRSKSKRRSPVGQRDGQDRRAYRRRPDSQRTSCSERTRVRRRHGVQNPLGPSHLAVSEEIPKMRPVRMTATLISTRHS